MDHVRKIVVMVAVCVGAMVAGCKTVPVARMESTEPREPDAVEQAAAVSRKLIEAGAPLSAAQAQGLLPPSEHTMKVAELPKFLAGERGFDEKAAAGAMAQLYEDFVEAKQGRQAAVETRPTGERWRSDAAFLDCTIWLYRWQAPSKMMPKGLLLSHEEGLGLSSYFLIENGVVVQAGYMVRREK